MVREYLTMLGEASPKAIYNNDIFYDSGKSA